MALDKIRQLELTVQGISHLEEMAKEWTDTQLSCWLGAGFRRLQNPTSVREELKPFPPLSGRMETNWNSQIDWVISSSYEAGFDWAQRIRKISLELAHTGMPPHPDVMAETTFMWNILPAPNRDTVQVVDKILPWAAGMAPSVTRDNLMNKVILKWLADESNDDPCHSFRQLKQCYPHLWESNFVVQLIYNQLNAPETDRLNGWLRIGETFAEDVKILLNPDHPAGRALISSTAKRLNLAGDEGPVTRNALKDRLLQLFDVPHPALPKEKEGHLGQSCPRVPMS